MEKSSHSMGDIRKRVGRRPVEESATSKIKSGLVGLVPEVSLGGSQGIGLSHGQQSTGYSGLAERGSRTG